MTDPLLVDAYQLDGVKDWTALAAAGAPWCGAILKATQGTYYRPAWFAGEMSRLRYAGGSRLGVDWFGGGYHYLDLALPGAAQADYLLASLPIDRWTAPGMLWPMVDVERGGQRRPGLTRGNVEDCVGAFAARVLAITGRSPTLYGGELLASLGIASRMGCGRLAIARYTPTLPHDVVTRIGWDAPALWQYCGDGEGYLADYPTTAPGCGKIDISVLTMAGGLAGLRAALSAAP